MNKKLRKILIILPYVVLLVLVFILVIPKFSENILNKGKDLGKIELIEKIVNEGKIPTGYTYCPYINWEDVKESLYIKIEPTVLNNKNDTPLREIEIEKQIEDILKPIKKLCEEKDLSITTQSISEHNQIEQNKGYEQALSWVNANFICEEKK